MFVNLGEEYICDVLKERSDNVYMQQQIKHVEKKTLRLEGVLWYPKYSMVESEVIVSHA